MKIAPTGFDYDSSGKDYSARRQTDPVLAAIFHEALGSARSVLNIGAGSGSYEPEDRIVLAVEPSSTMRSQRSPDRVPAIAASAEDLPFDNGAFDASMAMFTIHHWTDLAAGTWW